MNANLNTNPFSLEISENNSPSSSSYSTYSLRSLLLLLFPPIHPPPPLSPYRFELTFDNFLKDNLSAEECNGKGDGRKLENRK